MMTRNLGTIGGVFGLKERGEEDAWINRTEQEELAHLKSVEHVAGAIDQAHVVHDAHQVEKHLAKKELNSLLDEARHLAPQHVKDALIKWKVSTREKIDFGKKHAQALGEEQYLADAYDYSVESVPVTPFSGPAKYEYDPDITGRKIDKRSKEYRLMKQRISDNVQKEGSKNVGTRVMPPGAAAAATEAVVARSATKLKGASKSTASTQSSSSKESEDEH